jgi:hypothetical protein
MGPNMRVITFMGKSTVMEKILVLTEVHTQDNLKKTNIKGREYTFGLMAVST